MGFDDGDSKEEEEGEGEEESLAAAAASADVAAAAPICSSSFPSSPFFVVAAGALAEPSAIPSSTLSFLAVAAEIVDASASYNGSCVGSCPEACGTTSSLDAAVCALDESVAGTGIWLPVVGSPVSGNPPPPRRFPARAEDWKASERAKGVSFPEASALSVVPAGPMGVVVANAGAIGDGDDEEADDAADDEEATLSPTMERNKLVIAPPGPPPPPG